MTCRNGHTSERTICGGRLRCPDCYREGNRVRAEKRRNRAKGIDTIDPRHRCPYCLLVPCRCEEL